MIPDKTDCAYMAGMMDGEGSFSISYAVKWGAFISDMGFTVTDKCLVTWAQEKFGGSVYHRKVKNPRHRDTWRWRTHGHARTIEFILCILPYLVLKREQANIMLQFHRLPRLWMTEKRHELVVAIQSLNRRGKSPTTNTPCASSDEEVKIESDLIGDYESAPVVTQGSLNKRV